MSDAQVAAGLPQPPPPSVPAPDAAASASPVRAQQAADGETRLVFILQHGNHGAAKDFAPWEEILSREFPRSIFYRPSSNQYLKTHAGLKVMAERMTEETLKALRDAGVPMKDSEVDPNDNTKYKLIIVSHSLGGLITRAAVPAILAALDEERVKPVSFITLASPHLGSRRPLAQTAVGNAWKNAVHAVVGNLYGPTGKELLFLDGKDDTDRFMYVLAAPDGVYMTELRKFKWVTFIGASHGDFLVPYSSAVCCGKNPFAAPKNGDRPITMVGASGFPVGEEYERLFAHLREAPQKGATGDAAEFLTSPDNRKWKESFTLTEEELKEEYLKDQFSEVDFPPRLLHMVQEALPNLRRLVARYHLSSILIHDAWINKGVRHFLKGKDENGFNDVMSFFVEMFYLDLEIPRPANPADIAATATPLEEAATINE